MRVANLKARKATVRDEISGLKAQVAGRATTCRCAVALRSQASSSRRMPRLQGGHALFEYLRVLALVENKRTNVTIRIHVGHRAIVVTFQREIAPHDSIARSFDERGKGTAVKIAASGAHL